MENSAEHSSGFAEKCRLGAKGGKNPVREVIAKNNHRTRPKKAIQGMGILEANQ